MSNKILELLIEIIKQNGKIDKTINFLKQTLNKKESDTLAIFLLKLIKEYKGESKAIIEAENYLYPPQMCDYLINYYQENQKNCGKYLLK